MDNSQLFSAILPLLATYLSMVAIVGIVIYVYYAITLMAVAKKTGTPEPWMAWIPIANLVLMSRIAKQHWWPILLLIGFFIPFVNFIASIVFVIFMLIWQWKICEVRGKPGWWPILQLIPIVGGIWGIIMWGLVAWSD